MNNASSRYHLPISFEVLSVKLLNEKSAIIKHTDADK